jgi:hypothetical protein
MQATAVAARKTSQVWASPQVQRYSDSQFYAFTRGDVFVATTNVGSGHQCARSAHRPPAR